MLAVGANRAQNAEPLVIRYSGSVDGLRRAATRCLGASAILGALLGVGCLVAAVPAGGTLGPVLAVLGVTFPLLLVQDAGRVLCFALDRPRTAAANDAGWAAALIVALGVLLALPSVPLWAYVASWLGTGAIAGLVLLIQLHSRVAFTAVGRWLADTRDLGFPLVGAWALSVAPPYLLFALAPVVSDLEELGIARAAYIPFGPFGVVLQSAWLLLLPAATRRTRDGLGRLAARSSLGLAAVGAAWSGLVLLALVTPAGEWLLGDEWRDARTVAVVFAGGLVFQALAVGPLVALKALEAPRRLLRVRSVSGPLTLVSGLVLGATSGAAGLAFAMTLGDGVTAVLSWVVFRRLAQPEPRSSSTNRSQRGGALTGLHRAVPSPGRSTT